MDGGDLPPELLVPGLAVFVVAGVRWEMDGPHAPAEHPWAGGSGVEVGVGVGVGAECRGSSAVPGWSAGGVGDCAGGAGGGGTGSGGGCDAAGAARLPQPSVVLVGRVGREARGLDPAALCRALQVRRAYVASVTAR